MARTITARANEPQASFVDGPLLIAQQPHDSTTVIIAVTGTYKPSTSPVQTPNKPQHDTFLALLSTKTHLELDHPNKHESDEQLQQRKFDEDYLIAVRQSRYCGRYLDLLQRVPVRLYRNSEHFCATGGNCFHGPAPSTFPGIRNWSFALGEAKFDEDNNKRMRGEQSRRRCCRRCRHWEVVEPLAPEENEADRALGEMEEKLRTAVGAAAGLGDLKVVVSVSDATGIQRQRPQGKGEQIALLERLTARVYDVVIGWVEEGLVARDSLEIVWRPVGVTRRFGVLGSRDAFPFVYYDEEEEGGGGGGETL